MSAEPSWAWEGPRGKKEPPYPSLSELLVQQVLLCSQTPSGPSWLWGSSWSSCWLSAAGHSHAACSLSPPIPQLQAKAASDSQVASQPLVNTSVQSFCHFLEIFC